MIQFALGSEFFIEDNQKVLFLVVDRKEHFVTYAAKSIKEASDQLLEDKRNYPGHDFYIACYPIDLEEIVYLLHFLVDPKDSEE